MIKKYNVTYITEEGKILDYHTHKCKDIQTLSNNIKRYFEINLNRKEEDAVIYYNDVNGSLAKILQSDIIGFELEEV